MAGKILFAFDFDHTIIEGNSDTYVRDFFLKGGIRRCGPGENWTLYMQYIFQLLHKQNIDATEIRAAIQTLSPTDGMLSLLLSLCRPDCEVIIISDANSFFINSWLEIKGVSHIVKHVYTNPAHVDDTGSLNISMYQMQDGCKLCEKNLCKGSVLMRHIQERMSESIVFSRVVYVGDGKNDYCPCLKLSYSDLIFARSGYYLEKMIKKEKKNEPESIALKAAFYAWSSASDIY